MSHYIIDARRESPQIDILNITWEDYSRIIKSLESIIDLLENNNLKDDIYHEQYRETFLAQYKDLRDNLLTSQLPTRGMAVSIEDTVINELQKIQNQP